MGMERLKPTAITNSSLIALRSEGRTRFTKVLKIVQETDLTKKNEDSPNSAGFLIRHIAEEALLFAKSVFGLAEVKIVAQPLIAGKYNGDWTDLAELKELTAYPDEMLEKAVSIWVNWDQMIDTKEFGKRPKQKHWEESPPIRPTIRASWPWY